jgi:hypothetical protein
MLFVLGCNGNTFNPRVHGIREGEINNAEFTAKKNSGLSAYFCEVMQSAASPSGQNKR